MPMNEELVASSGPEKSEKDAACAYDVKHGRYECNVDDHATVRAGSFAASPKKPLKLSGGSK